MLVMFANTLEPSTGLPSYLTESWVVHHYHYRLLVIVFLLLLFTDTMTGVNMPYSWPISCFPCIIAMPVSQSFFCAAEVGGRCARRCKHAQAAEGRGASIGEKGILHHRPTILEGKAHGAFRYS